MIPALTLLDGVAWRGEPVVGDRPAALLAALASAGRVVRAEQLVAAVWGEDEPANPAKALQVLVSRTRTACGPDSVVRDGDGYRLGVPASEVDSGRLAELATTSRAAFERDPGTAAAHARAALDLGAGLIAVGDADGPLADLRRDAAEDLRDVSLVLARALSRLGDHAEALPLLEAGQSEQPDDEGLLADLLRSEAAVRGSAAALERYEAYRSGLRDRLGTDPGEALQRLHVELLAVESPVREGVRYDANSLLGRDQDIRRLRALLGTSRVVSILGPGGLGKTRLAHVLGRGASEPVVHFVELVGVTSPDDVIGEVGSALGVRDSVSGRRALTPEQRADVRARIAQQLDHAPTLLILDNCEHVVAAVADLVAFLVATTRELRVLTTTRSPLAISAERVYPLGELAVADGTELFRQRAMAARPDVHLDEAEVAEVVARLDGLPLAIELAAAKVRVMSVAEIGRRLENRFALLRGGDRSAPDRHQTLLAVIDWSWNLLDEPQRRALRRLSVFHDGFSLAAAEAVLGDDALAAVGDLSDQSLVSVVEGATGIRFRMLETVREFGRMQLVDAGEDASARAAQRDWALAYSDRHTAELFGQRQFEAVDAFRAEENNLADVLRQALAAPDPRTVVHVLAGLGSFWTILGDHPRVFVLAEAIGVAVDDWVPDEESKDAARVAIAMTANNAVIAGDETAERLRQSLERIGPDSADPRIAAMVRIMVAFAPLDDSFLDTLRDFAASPDRNLAVSALQWISHLLENQGDPTGALEAAEEALAITDPDDGPWHAAILRTQVAQFAMQLGRREEAVEHARLALPVLERLGARDDTMQLRAMFVLFAVARGELDEATAELQHLEDVAEGESLFGGRLVIDLGRAELMLARGETEAGLAAYRTAVAKVRSLRFPGIPATGLEPWVLFGEATALTAHGEYAPEDPAGNELFAATLDRVRRVLDPEFSYLDFPVCGVGLFALGAWGLRCDAMPEKDAVRLLVLADRFAYNRTVPSVAWERIESVAEAKAPGLLAEVSADLGEGRGPDLLAEARALVDDIP